MQLVIIMSEFMPYDIQVNIKPVYMAAQSNPEQDIYVFAYTINIVNIGTIAAQLLTRYWLITDANNKVQEVYGEGVIGVKPHLHPGENFEYTSSAVIATPVGSMQGSYQMLADDGVRFETKIPAFSLSQPHLIH
jgi:ApaG protein